MNQKLATTVAGKLTSKMGLVAILGVAAIGGVALVSSNVFASLNATAFNTTAQNISVGTLKLTQAGVGNGITTAIGPIQPGDTQNRYVDVTNGGSLAGSAMTLQLADAQAPASVTAISAAAGTVTYTAVNSFVAGQTVTITGATAPAYNLVNATIASATGTQFTVTSAATGATSTATATPLSTLTSDATNGLQVTISVCTGGTWTPGTGVCSGTTNPVLASTAASVLKGAAQTLTPTNLSLTAGGVSHLKISMNLPSTLAETTINGVLPATTLQGAVGSVTWTFTEAQVTGGVTNS
ncbi:MAG: hypothetical protein WCO08_06045 [Actinomycetes bacterium]